MPALLATFTGEVQSDCSWGNSDLSPQAAQSRFLDSAGLPVKTGNPAPLEMTSWGYVKLKLNQSLVSERVLLRTYAGGLTHPGNRLAAELRPAAGGREEDRPFHRSALPTKSSRDAARSTRIGSGRLPIPGARHSAPAWFPDCCAKSRSDSRPAAVGPRCAKGIRCPCRNWDARPAPCLRYELRLRPSSNTGRSAIVREMAHRFSDSSRRGLDRSACSKEQSHSVRLRAW